MAKYKAAIDIMPLPALLDPQGKAVGSGLSDMGLGDISQVRIGKHVTLEVEAGSEDVARDMVDTACKKLLVNEIMEHYTFELQTA